MFPLLTDELYKIYIRQALYTAFGTSYSATDTFFVVEDRYVDLHFHDTMVVVAMNQALWLMTTFLFLEWLVYAFFLNRRHSRYLTWIHILSTILALVVIIFLYVSSNRPTSGDKMTWETYQLSASRKNTNLLISVILLVFSQLVFVFNFIGAFFRRS